jgi:3-methyladenine DNA glycosylase AlkD
VDSLCQSTFTAQDLLIDWGNWGKMLTKLSVGKNISRRRASLVLLCKSVRGSDDARLADVAFANLDRLKEEKDILISKAVSWLLRALIKHHRLRVKDFVAKNRDVLPKFVVREVENKLQFGKKVIRKV